MQLVHCIYIQFPKTMCRTEPHFDCLGIMSAWRFTQTTDCSQGVSAASRSCRGGAMKRLEDEGQFSEIQAGRCCTVEPTPSEHKGGGDALIIELGWGVDQHWRQGEREFQRKLGIFTKFSAFTISQCRIYLRFKIHMSCSPHSLSAMSRESTQQWLLWSYFDVFSLVTTSCVCNVVQP